jgi:23S rRNA pseudouridine2605 synthase
MARTPDSVESPVSGERIAKVMARAGLCSRREAEAWIVAGRVKVNNETIRSPARNVGAADRIAVDDVALPQRERTRLFLYHKARGLVTSHGDPQGRPTIFAGLPAGLPRLISVGRLDINTEGLLLLTNDGGLARALELPATGWLRRYRVRVHGGVNQGDLDRLRGGITIDGVSYGAIEATLDRAQGANAWLTFSIREGKNREVKNVLGHLGLAVNRLIRVSFGPFGLGDLPEGAVEEVKTRVLREQLSERLATSAGVDFSAPILVRETRKEKVTPSAKAIRPEREPRGARARSEPRSETAPRSRRRGSDAAEREPGRAQAGGKSRHEGSLKRAASPPRAGDQQPASRHGDSNRKAPPRNRQHGPRPARPKPERADKRTAHGHAPARPKSGPRFGHKGVAPGRDGERARPVRNPERFGEPERARFERRRRGHGRPPKDGER